MRTFLAILWLCIWAIPSYAQVPMTGAGLGSPTAAVAGFQGPGDITSGAVAFYSAGRAYNAAYAAAQNPLADIVDTTTGLATCTFNVGTNGFANLSAVVCPTGAPTVSVTTFCTVTHAAGCRVTKLYDQTGNGNHVVQATIANTPGLTLSAQNGLPCLTNLGGGSIPVLQTAGNVIQAAPFTKIGVAERTNNVTTRQDIIANTASNRLAYTNSANSVTVNNGTNVNLTAADAAFHALLVIASGTAPLFAVDSSANISTSTNGTGSTSGALAVMNNNTSSNPILAGNFFCEAGEWPADLNSSYQAMLANMRSASNGWNF